MKIEELNKTQIVLLTLLVSFVTSIATGVVTVTLMDQAPPEVVRTVNRIVERTVERVVPGETQVATVIKEVPVIVTEENLIVKVINDSSPSVLKIVKTDAQNTVVGNAFAFESGRLITTSNLFTTTAEPTSSRSSSRTPVLEPKDYVVVNERSQTIELESLTKSADGRFVVITLKTPDLSSSENVIMPVALKFAGSPVSIGQTVVALGFDMSGESNVSVGIVSSATVSSTSTPIAKIATNAASSNNLGAPLLNINGEVVGLSEAPGLAAPSSEVKKYASSI